VRLTSFWYLPNGSVGECLKPKTHANRLLHLINMFSFELFILFLERGFEESFQIEMELPYFIPNKN
jgi:hypothetical protein